MNRVIALHGFLGRGSDWAAVRAAAAQDTEWTCPDLFAPDDGDWRTPPPDAEGAWLLGYSFGARLALRWLQDEPGRWRGALLLSVNPGNFLTEDERITRRRADAAWAEAFRGEAWAEVMERWNKQGVFRGSAAPVRREEEFDREKLVSALEDFSLSGQTADPACLRGQFCWMAGAEDPKFCGLLAEMRDAGFPGRLVAVPEGGHRLLFDRPDAVAAELDGLVSM